MDRRTLDIREWIDRMVQCAPERMTPSEEAEACKRLAYVFEESRDCAELFEALAEPPEGCVDVTQEWARKVRGDG